MRQNHSNIPDPRYISTFNQAMDREAFIQRMCERKLQTPIFNVTRKTITEHYKGELREEESEMSYSLGNMALKPEHEEEYESYLSEYDGSSCYCSATDWPPCGHCEGSGTHPGNPLHLISEDKAWEPILVSAIRQFKENGFVEFEEFPHE